MSTKVRHANPFTYHPVTKAEAKKLENIVVRAPGVQNVAYAPSGRTIQIYLKKNASVAQRVIADRLVNQVLHPAVTTSPTKTTHKKHKKHKHH